MNNIGSSSCCDSERQPGPRHGMISPSRLSRLKELGGVGEADLGGGHGDLAHRGSRGRFGHHRAVRRLRARPGRRRWSPLYHLDGDRLLLTHDCMAGNPPRMQLDSFDPASGELRFEFADATGLASLAARQCTRRDYWLEDREQFSASGTGWKTERPRLKRSSASPGVSPVMPTCGHDGSACAMMSPS
jgi:hypothetical protein